MKKAIKIDDGDNVATVSSNLSIGEDVEVLSPDGDVILRTKALEAVPSGHKIALGDLARGSNIFKYGEVIGVASNPIAVGSWVHVHNVESATVPTKEMGKGEAA